MRLNAQITVGALACLGLALLSGSASADWQKTAMLLASDGESWDEFGYTVALSGDDAAIGAWAEGDGVAELVPGLAV
ncbi:MAG: FG-GAP repeat protein [Phycisphaerales bacterium JB038]